MNNIIVVDTDILIDSARSIQVAIDKLESLTNDYSIAISIITKMELIVGCRNKNELQNLEKFLGNYTLIPVNENISHKAVELLINYKLSHGLLIPDAFIAATAISINAYLLSKNQRDYRFINELNLHPYP
ncbi:type II toxin-antitoxin system VapC family toxin [Aphanizomenon sp. CS-733/32]|uniref:type II toxin-antitoxin system VapC family toxin n=1 Tax=Aphanizomenon sp. CS-733/32 TaxID=3021715 RepID=UPI00232AF4FB|nr:type II toxin-antitoxin system VapC family toxin [Aphanizomenon sp. CS-733/32]MDB9307918.1 type II toxin-antitoxin system VapC family toxin [Aphanizomenon sp. CS-733/32]